MSDIPCQLRMMQHEVDKDTAGLLLNAKVLSGGYWLANHSILYIELNAWVELTLFLLLLSYVVLQWLHFHTDSLCSRMSMVSLLFCFHLCVGIQFVDRQVDIHSNRGARRRLGKVASMVVDKGYSAELLRRIIARSCHVSCDSREAKTAAVDPPSPSSSLLPFPLPSLPNIKGSLWHGLGCAGRLAGAAALRAIYGLILYERPAVKLESHQLCSFILVSSSSIRLFCSLTHTSMPLVCLPLSLFSLRSLCHILCNGWIVQSEGTWNVTLKHSLICSKEGFLSEWFSDATCPTTMHHLSNGLVTSVILHLDTGCMFATAVTQHIS